MQMVYNNIISVDLFLDISHAFTHILLFFFPPFSCVFEINSEAIKLVFIYMHCKYFKIDHVSVWHIYKA